MVMAPGIVVLSGPRTTLKIMELNWIMLFRRERNIPKLLMGFTGFMLFVFGHAGFDSNGNL
jgi:hypothetical protein